MLHKKGNEYIGDREVGKVYARQKIVSVGVYNLMKEVVALL